MEKVSDFPCIKTGVVFIVTSTHEFIVTLVSGGARVCEDPLDCGLDYMYSSEIP